MVKNDREEWYVMQDNYEEDSTTEVGTVISFWTTKDSKHDAEESTIEERYTYT